MTQEQIVLVKKSWRLFRQIDPLLVGGVFYDRLFADAPGLRRMFHTSVEEQSQKLVDMLSTIILHLDALDDLKEKINALAQRHAQYGVKPEHYETVGKALLWTLKQGLGRDWNDETEEAWAKCYYTLADLMIYAPK